MPSSAPVWVSYAALAVAAGALATAVAALLVNFLNYRSSGRLVRLRARFDESRETLIVIIFNRGRSDAEIERLELRCPPNTTWKIIDLTPHLKEGSQLKHVLPSGTSARWEVSLCEAINADLERGYRFVPAQAHLVMAWTRPVAPRVRVTLATNERRQSFFIAGLGRIRFKRLYSRLFWVRFPEGDKNIYQRRRDW